MPGEALFDPGSDYPVFEVKGARYGISICSGTWSADAAARITGQRAPILLVPAQHMMRRQHAQAWPHRHHQIRAGRVREAGMWLVPADVTGERGDTHTGYGPASVLNPSADVVAQVPLMETGMVIAQIPAPGPHLRVRDHPRHRAAIGFLAATSTWARHRRS